MQNYCFLITICACIIACQPQSDLTKLDEAANQAVTEQFSQHSDSLWYKVEHILYQGIGAPHWNADNKYKILADFINTNPFNEWPSTFYLNHDNPETQKLVDDLATIGLTKEDEAAHVFLHQLLAKDLQSLNFNSDLKEKAPMISSYVLVAPDSLSLSSSLMGFGLSERFSEADLKRPGLYKLLVIFYFSEMMNRK